MKENILKIKSYSFALNVVHKYKFLINEKKEFVLSKQLLRSGTSVGAMIREAEYAQSKMDFIHKLSIAQKECNETLYWIDLLVESSYLNNSIQENLKNDCTELLKLLTSIILSTKRNLNQKSN